MKQNVLWVLVALNVLLAVALAGRMGSENTAQAQNAPRRRIGEFIMIPGKVSGGANSVMYFIDTNNSMLGAMAYDDSRQVINSMDPIDLNRIFQVEADQP